MFSKRSTENELMDDLSLHNDELRKNLDELEVFNSWFGSKKLLMNALNKIYHKYDAKFKNSKIVIGDLGCGGGDLLRAVDSWAKSKKLNIELIGIDANPFMVEYAAKKSHTYSNIHFKTFDILSPKLSKMQFDIICINSICHHFNDAELVKLFKHAVKQTHLAIIINDLHRHWLSYFTIKCLSKLLKFTYLAKNDAPLSVLKAFRKNELDVLLKKANLTTYQIQWIWPFRWEIIIWCA